MVSDMFTAIFRTSALTAPVIAVMLLLGNRIDRNYHVKGKCLIWMLVSLRLLVPFSADVDQAAIVVQTPLLYESSSQATVWTKYAEKQSDEKEAADMEYAAQQGSVKVACIWALGCIVLALYYFVGYRLFVGRIKREVYICSDEKVQQVFQRLLQEKNVQPKRLYIQRSPSVTAPVLVGFFKYSIILPELEYKERELYFILKHELMHYLHRDIWKKLLILSACVLHWFNPLCWLMHRQAALDLERYCDSNVIEKSDFQTRKEYSQILLNSLEYSNRIMILTDGFDGGARKMRKRIENIMKMGKRKGRVLTAAAAVVLLGTSQIAFGESVAEPIVESVGTDLVESGKNGTQGISLEAVAEDSYYEVARKRYDAFTEGTNYISYSVYANLTAEQMEEIGRLEYLQLQSGDMDIVDECSLAFYEEDSDVLIYAFIYDKDGVHTEREDAVYVSGKTFVRFEPEKTEDLVPYWEMTQK